MATNTFEINLLEVHWINGAADDTNDLCAHGCVFAQIGEETVCDRETLDVTVSAAGLHLMRTLTGNYRPNMFTGQLLPHCGYFMIPSNDLQTVELHGCNDGVDWYVNHIYEAVELTTINGTKAIVPFEEYSTKILHFADAVKQLYDASLPKKLPDDELIVNGYKAFRNEWHTLRNRF